MPTHFVSILDPRSSLLQRLLASQKMMVVPGESMSLVSDRLQDSESGVVAPKADGRLVPGAMDFLLAFGQGQQHRWAGLQSGERFQRGVELSFAAVDEQNVGRFPFVFPFGTESPKDDFADGSVVVDAL